MKHLFLTTVLFFILTGMIFSQVTRPKISQMELAPGINYTIVTDIGGVQTYQLIENDVIDSFYITATDSLCIAVSDSWSGDPLGTFCVPFFEPDPTLYVDSVYTVNSATFTPGIPLPVRDDYWEVFLNGVRLAATEDWVFSGADIILQFPDITTDRVVIRYPE